MRFKIFFAAILICFSQIGFSQSSTRGALVTIDTSTFSNSAGFIRPTIKMLAVNRLDNSVVYWDLSSWSTIATVGSNGSNWTIIGNSGTIAGDNFLGTTDEVDLVLKTNGIEIGRFGSDGNKDISFSGGTSSNGGFSVTNGVASANSATAFSNGVASGQISTAFSNGVASGQISTAFSNGVASALFSTSWSAGSVASGQQSTAWAGATASGTNSTAWDFSTASGVNSTSAGNGTKSKSFSGFAVGSYNDSTNATNSTGYNVLNRAFQVGIGQSDGTRANAMTILFNGNTGIGTVSPTSKLQVVGLPVYANNAAAIAGGLTVGAFYRTGADPDPVCVVH